MVQNRFKYANPARTSKGLQPQQWHTGPDPVTHDKYYAFLKHRAQAKFRGEKYLLTWQDWQRIWPNKLWTKRGRKPHQLSLTMKDKRLGWCVNNLQIRTREDHMRWVASVTKFGK